MSENDENKCPTCGATGTDPCVTKSGSPAKKMHATRKIAAKVDEVRETAKQRFDRFKAERKAREKREKESPTFDRPVGNRESRRKNGMRKTVHRGAMRRRKRLNANAEVGAFWHPEPEAVSTDSE